MNISELQIKIHENAVNKGWWETDRSHGELIALMHSELSEALEELRDGREPATTYFNQDNPNKPEGVPPELADVIIRILDYCGKYNIDMQSAIELKMRYNETRPYKHGKQF